MRVSTRKFENQNLNVDLLCLPLFKDSLKKDKNFRNLDKLLKGQLLEIIKSNFFEGEKSEIRTIIPHPKQNIKELVLIGLGDSKSFKLDQLRKAAGIAGKKCTNKNISTVGFILPDLNPKKASLNYQARSIAEGVNLGGYFLDRFKSSKQERSKAKSLTLFVSKNSDIKDAQKGAKYGLIVSDMQNYCRNLVALPSNELTPSELANHARKLARKHGLKAQIYNKAQVEKWKMGAFLGVAKASAEPLKFIRLDYKPKGKAKRKIVLVGKGITFDTGGISIKPGLNMEQMVGDMGGAAVVLCVSAALAQLKPDFAFTTLIPTCENMPGGKAYKPGDVLTASNGKTIEVINTDAEGRLILADALAYGSKLKPDFMIDVATLTGAIITTLGYVGAGIFSTEQKLVSSMKKASETTGEKVWELPLWEEFDKSIKSHIADIKNSAGRPGGSCTAAAFLKHFTDDLPWMHFDIANMDLEFSGSEYMPKGTTGYGVRILTEMLSNLG